MSQDAPTGSPDGTGVDYRALYLREKRRFERERAIRLEAEGIAERGLAELHDQNRRREILHRVASQANSKATRDETFRFALQAVCEHGGWSCGSVFVTESDGGQALVSAGVIYTEASDLMRFVQATAAIRFKRGQGLIGDAWAAAKPVWVENVLTYPGYLRAPEARAAALFGAVAVPILIDDEIVAVVEFHARNVRAPDEDALVLLQQIATQLSRVMERERAACRLAYDATHDALTGLPNRPAFHRTLQARLGTGRPVAVFFVDLDRFKPINDSLGHAAGDRLLLEIAARLSDAIRSTDDGLLARLGGDEFAVLLPETDPAGALATANALVAAVEHPIVVAGQTVNPSASIGIAFGTSGTSPDEVLRSADLAMYRAKQAGGGRAALYDPSLHVNAMRRVSLEGALRQAVEDGSFLLAYQPIVDLQTRRSVGFEALVRWRRPDGTMVPPGDFIPLAEDTGLIVPLGEWVLREACRTAARWNRLRAGRPPAVISVNASSRQFQGEQFRNQVTRALDDAGASGDMLRIEITEGVAVRVPAGVRATLDALRTIGVGASIDDFGTGYSSLSQLRKLPFDTLKIDRSFVSDLASGAEGQAMVRAIVSIARSLGLKTVAEGAETAQEVDALTRLGCDAVQGYFFAKPMLEKEAWAWLTGNDRAGDAEVRARVA